MLNSLPASAETQEAIVLVHPTIGELRKKRFQDCTANVCRIAEYLEQLSAQTGTNIDEWTLEPFVGIEAKDRRAINRVFFARKQEKMEGFEALSVEVEASIADAAVRSRELLDARKRDLVSAHNTHLKEAERISRSAQDYIRTAWNARKELYALEERGADYITTDLKKLLQEGFWEFKKYDDGILTLTTKNNVVMAETNLAAGVDHSVNLGKYQAQLDVRQMRLKLHRFEKNALANEAFWHPYVSVSGEICWGSAASTAAKMLSLGEAYNVLSLLASLLVTYSPDASPYARLLDFVRCKKRLDAGQKWHEFNDEGEALCLECWYVLNACTCCKKCKRNTDNCVCCAHCSENKHDCDCCQSCGKKPAECGRCQHCYAHDDGCGCCQECGRNKSRLKSMGHRDMCSKRRKVVEGNAVPYAPNTLIEAIQAAVDSAFIPSPLSRTLPPNEHTDSDETHDQQAQIEDSEESDEIEF